MFSTIRSKLIAILFILGIFPLLITGFFFYRSASIALQTQSWEQLGKVAAKTTQQIDSFFKVAKKDIELLSKFPFVQLSFLQYDFGLRSDNANALLRDFREKNGYFNRITLMNLDGEIILTEPSQQEISISYSPSSSWFQTTLKQDVFLTELEVKEGFPSMILAKLVYDFEDHSKPVGMLVFDLKLTAVTRFVTSLGIGSERYAFLIDKNDIFLSHPLKNLGPVKELFEIGDSRLTLLLGKIRAGETGSGDYRLNGIEKNMVFAPCKVMDWSVVITLDKSKQVADILRLRRQMITFVSVIVGLIFLVSFVFVRSITGPITQLINGVRAIGNGDLEPVVEVRSGDEFKGLAREFNHMAVRLKQSMNEILELKTFNEDIFRSITSGIITMDLTERITSVNQSAEHILSLPREKFFPGDNEHVPEKLHGIVNLLKKILSSNSQGEVREIYVPGTGGREALYMEVSTSPLRNSRGEIIGAMSDIRDITRRKRMEEQMVRVDKLASLGELSSGMAHEIRNPLAGMKTSAQVLVGKFTQGPEKVLVCGILSEINRINGIVTDLLNFSRPNPSIPAPVDLSEILDKTQSLVMEKIRTAGIKVFKKDSPDLYQAMVDREQVQQVFLNLMLNAVKSMPDGGSLQICTESIDAREAANKYPVPEILKFPERGGYILVSFKDSGYGIPRENLPKVFNPFYTTDPSGTGLGLSIVQKLLEKNNGAIHIDSTLGRGTHVTILLPRAALPVSGDTKAHNVEALVHTGV